MDSLTMRQTQVRVRVNSFVRSVYNWMAIGLALTGFIAYAVANVPEVRDVIFGSRIVFFGLIIAQLALVFIIRSRIQRMQAGTATLLFDGQHLVGDNECGPRTGKPAGGGR